MNGFTPTQRSMLEVLADGLPHTRYELHDCLPDGLSDIRSIRKHLCMLRKKLQPRGMDIICEIRQGVTYYRRVVLIARGE